MDCIDHGQKGQGLGYGSSRYRGVRGTAHRIVYCKTHGVALSSIKGLVVRHTCDNARCINPEHLVLGTHQDNMADRCARQRTNKGEARPQSKLTKEDVSFIRANYKRYSKVWNTNTLAKRFNVQQSLIQRVVVGESWAHIE